MLLVVGNTLVGKDNYGDFVLYCFVLNLECFHASFSLSSSGYISEFCNESADREKIKCKCLSLPHSNQQLSLEVYFEFQFQCFCLCVQEGDYQDIYGRKEMLETEYSRQQILLLFSVIYKYQVSILGFRAVGWMKQDTGRRHLGNSDVFLCNFRAKNEQMKIIGELIEVLIKNKANTFSYSWKKYSTDLNS